MMENPVLEFSKAQGLTRSEFSRKTGISCQVLRDVELGSTKQMSVKTLGFLNHVGIDGDEMQKKLSEWHSAQHENRKNVLSNKEEVLKIQDTPEPVLADKQVQTPPKNEAVDDLLKICMKHDPPASKPPKKQLPRKNPAAEVNEINE